MRRFKQITITTEQPQTCVICLRSHRRGEKVLVSFDRVRRRCRRPSLTVVVCNELCLIDYRDRKPANGDRNEKFLSRISVQFNKGRRML